MPKKSKHRYRDPYRSVLDALAYARRNDAPIDRAAPLTGTTMSEVRRLAGRALVYEDRHWWARLDDDLPRRMRFLTERGYIAITTHDSRDASLIGEYNNAIRDYLQPPHPVEGLIKFEHAYIVSGGRRYEFVTDTRTINRLARAGVIYFMDLYADGRP